MTKHRLLLRDLASSGVLVALLIAPTVMAREEAASPVAPAVQAPAGRGAAAPAPAVTSPEVATDRRVTFRILAPEAQKVVRSRATSPASAAAALAAAVD
jgi:hypothetical protein